MTRSRPHVILLAFVTPMLLAGCVGVAKRAAPSLDSAATGPAPELSPWWKAFGDSGLNGSVDTALDANPDLAVLVARIAESREL